MAAPIASQQNLALYTVQKRAVQLGLGSGPKYGAARGVPHAARPWSGPPAPPSGPS